MKTSVTLELKTREAYQLFTRKIKDDRLFIDAILSKINKVTKCYNKEISVAEEQYHLISQSLTELTQQFELETKQYLALIQENPTLKDKTITIKPQFIQVVKLETPLTDTLVTLIGQYDHLLSTIKLLHLIGCFKNTSTYYSNIKRIQIMMNSLLSSIITMHSTVA